MPSSAIRSCPLLPVLLIFNLIGLPSLSRAMEESHKHLAKAQDAGDHDAVREICLRMLKKNPSDTGLLRILAKIQLRSAESEACRNTLALLESALGNPDADLLEMRGDLADLRQDPASREQAALHWKTSLNLQPDRISAVSKLANYYRSLPSPAEEAVYIEQLASLRGHPAELIRLARHAVRLRDWDTIISCTARLQQKFANLKPAKLWQPVYDRLMRHSVALKRLDNLLEEMGESAEILLDRAWLFDRIGLAELAVDDAEQAYRITPESFAVKYQLAVILAHAGMTAEAANRLKIEVSKYARRPLHPSLNFFSVLTEIEDRIAGNPDAKAHCERAKMLLEIRQEELALDDAAAAVAIDPELTGAHLILARVFASRNKMVAAKAAYNRILHLEENHPAALEELGMLHMKLGDYTNAIPLLRRRLDLGHDTNLQVAYQKCFASLQLPTR